MKHNFFKTSICLVLSLFLLLSSCQKQIDTTFEEPVLKENFKTEAQAWFANGPVLQEKKILDLPFNVLPKLALQRLFARMGKMQKKLEWENAEFYNREGVAYLAVPVTTNLKKYGNEHEIAKSIVFYKEKGEAMKMNVVEVLSKKGTSLQDKAKEITATAFISKIKNQKGSIAGINADLFFYNEEYKNIGSYKFTNGVIVASPNKLGNNNSQANLVTETENSSCQTWYIVYDEYNQNGELVYWEILYSYQTGNCGNGGDPEEEMPEGGGGEEYNLEIQNNVSNPCIKNSVNNAINAGCTNKISSFINNVFGNSDIFILHFFDGALVGSLANNDANTATGLLYFGNQIVTKTVITFNTNQLTGASQEYIAATILHEAVHAWIDYKFPVAIENSQQHNLMASGNKFDLMYDALREMFPNLAHQDAYDLTWGGLFNTIGFNSLPSVDKDRIAQTNDNYKFRTNGIGTPC